MHIVLTQFEGIDHTPALPLAVGLLTATAKKDPRLQQDYEDFKKLYAEGTVDFARIWTGKEERHNCTIEEGAPHQ